MSDDPAPRSTAAPGSNPRLIAVVSDLPATWLDAEDVRIIRDRMARNHYDPNATEALRVLLCGIHELCIEIERCHERTAAQEARPAAADAVIAAARALAESCGQASTGIYGGDDLVDVYDAMALAAVESALAAYDAPDGAGEGMG